MDPITAAAASGLRARMEALDMLANNIANASTSGFKRDGEFYSTWQEVEAQLADPDSSIHPVIERNWTDFSQGTLQQTGNPLDLALSGDGWFSLTGPSGPLYTRNGSFRTDSTGLVTSEDGLPLRIAGGAPLRIRRGIPLQVDSDGTVRQSGVPLGRLEIVRFPAGTLAKQGDTLFRSIDPNISGTPAAGTEVHQGKLEGANVTAAESAVRLVSLARQFESLQRSISIGAEMNRKAVEELARTGS